MSFEPVAPRASDPSLCLGGVHQNLPDWCAGLKIMRLCNQRGSQDSVAHTKALAGRTLEEHGFVRGSHLSSLLGEAGTS